MIVVALVVIVAALILLLLSGDSSSIAGMHPDDFARAVYFSAFGLVIAAFLLRSVRFQFWRLITYALGWTAVFLAVIAGYSYREDLNSLAGRVYGELSPTVPIVRTAADGTTQVSVRRTLSGHFGVTAQVNGVATPMMVDTGASVVTLTQDDARAVGIDPGRLDYAHPVGTANGTVRMAIVRLRDIRVGPIRTGEIEAFVAPRDALDQSLLGLNFLNKLHSYEVRGNTLSLRGEQ